MGESQQITGSEWNSKINRILAALGWTQLGSSQVDVYCELCRNETTKTHGLDSVFHYEDPLQNGVKEGFFIEAKEYAWKNAPRSEIQAWYDDLLECIDHLPMSTDFRNKYSPAHDTRFTNGLITLFHHDTYDDEKFKKRLAQLDLPHRKNTRRIFIISNWQIIRLTAVLNEKKRLEESDHQINFFFPSYGKRGASRSNVLPIEYLLDIISVNFGCIGRL